MTTKGMNLPMLVPTMCDHSREPGGREAAMVVLEPRTAESRGVLCDPCIAPIVKALNGGGIRTIASCCGHGHRPGRITLADGRELFIAPDFDTASEIERAFPIDINGSDRSLGAER